MDSQNTHISVITPTIRPLGLSWTQQCLGEQKFSGNFEWLVDINYTGESDLNASYNRLISRAKGELIVSLQDYIKLPKDGLQRFWNAHTKEPAFYTAPIHKGKWDWRIHTTKSDWQKWEIDCGSAPRQALIDIGGFDEALDDYWGFDNINVGLRADMAGYKFYCLPELKCDGYDHEKDGHPFRHLRNPIFHNARLDDIRQGLKLNYLKSD